MAEKENNKKIIIPFGPQHPAFKESMRLDLCVDGEIVEYADIIVSYNHRGIEKAAEQRTFLQNIYLIERVCGICSHSHTTCYCAAVEEIMGIEVPERAQYIRSFIGELERIQSHLLWIGVTGHELGWDTLLMYSWKDRERINDMLERITGNRIHYAMNTFGGVRRDLSPGDYPRFKEDFDFLEERTKYYLHVIAEEETFLKRTRGIAFLPTEMARRLCAVGPTTRASNVRIDARADDPYAAYPDLDFEVVTHDSGDVWARTYVKALEILQSIRMCRQVLDEIPGGEIRVKAPLKVPEGEAICRYEAPRGELIHYVRSSGGTMPDRIKIRSPTFGNWVVATELLKGICIADVPIVVYAIDPCMSCSARITVTDSARGTVTETTFDALRRRGRQGKGAV
jgi:NADH-quinone oxidoreductase subunit D